MTLTAAEQLLVEMINRARLDPLAEAARYGIDLNAGLAPGTLDGTARQALAPNALLHAAATAHSRWMLEADVFSHTGAGGSSAHQRMVDAGYVFAGSFRSGENLSWAGSTGTVDAERMMRDTHHESLFLSEGHRANMLNAGYREVGVAQELGVFTQSGNTYNASMVTENFARSGSTVFVTGVTYSDRDGDGFYTMGEARAGVAVSAAGAGTTQSAAAGGYALALAGGAGTASVTIGGIALRVDLGNGNAKLDLVDGAHILTSATLYLDGAAASVTALGAGDIALTGHGGADRLTGNSGDNTLAGGGCNDTLVGGAGDDRLIGGAGVDLAVFDMARADAVIRAGASGTVEIVSGQGSDILSGVERVQFSDGIFDLDDLFGGVARVGGGGNDALTGTAGNDTLTGGGGRDLLSGLGGADLLVGDRLEIGLVPIEASQVWRLYQSTLGRTPDDAGHLAWTGRLLEGGHSLGDLAVAFVTSAEFQSRFAQAADNAAFVTLLYQNVLGRQPDPGGLAGWTARLDTQERSRADLVLAFSESAENRAGSTAVTKTFLEARTDAVWSDDVFRIYQAALDRSPDPAGFAGWTARMGEGRPLLDMVSGFVDSTEFRARYADTATSEAFVTRIYQNVLERGPDPVGLAGWTARLDDQGWSRAEVVLGIGQSREFVARSSAALNDWMRAQGTDDTLNGGAGDTILIGGMGSDRFVFEASAPGHHRITDPEPWDDLQFVGFGYRLDAEVRAHMTQTGSSVTFSDQGVSVVIEGMTLAAITDEMILL